MWGGGGDSILPSYPALYSITYPPVYIVLSNEIDTLVEHTLSNEPHTQGVQVQVGEYLTIGGTGIDILVITHKLYGGMVYDDATRKNAALQ